MEILTLTGGRSLHEEAPMDLSTSTSRLRHHPLPIMLSHRAPWTSLGAERSPKYFLEPLPKLPQEPVAARSPPSSSSMSHCIPIPKKRHCLARTSPPPAAPPAALRVSPPSRAHASPLTRSPEVARKRARLESPEPSDARRDARPFRREEVAAGAISSSSGGGGMRGAGAGPARSNGDVGATGEGNTQSAMWPQQSRQLPADVGGGSPRGGSPLGEERLEEPNQVLLSTLMQLQNAQFSSGLAHPPAPALKDTDALLSAIHQSQMLYYSYCSQLIQTLRSKQAHQEQQQQKKRHEERQTRLEHEAAALKRQSSTSSSSHEDFQTHVEECEDADDGDEYLDVTDEDHVEDINSILRTRLNTQVRTLTTAVCACVINRWKLVCVR